MIGCVHSKSPIFPLCLKCCDWAISMIYWMWWNPHRGCCSSLWCAYNLRIISTENEMKWNGPSSSHPSIPSFSFTHTHSLVQSEAKNQWRSSHSSPFDKWRKSSTTPRTDRRMHREREREKREKRERERGRGDIRDCVCVCNYDEETCACGLWWHLPRNSLIPDLRSTRLYTGMEATYLMCLLELIRQVNHSLMLGYGQSSNFILCRFPCIQET